MARKNKKSKSRFEAFVGRVFRAGEAFFQTPEAERATLRRLQAENIVLNNNCALLQNKAAQLSHALEVVQSAKDTDESVVEQLRSDLAWEKQQRIVLEQKLKEFETSNKN